MFGDLRLAHARHWRVANLTFIDQPLEEGLDAAEAVGGGGRLPACELVLDERFEVLAADGRDVGWHAALVQKGVKPIEAGEVGALGGG